MSNNYLKIAIVGLGPRGLSVLERLISNIAENQLEKKIEIHVIDPFPFGAGKVWRTDQANCLLMNTVASQITLFTDSTVECDGPIKDGPNLYEWARFIEFFCSKEEYNDVVFQEAKRIGPNSYSTRAFYGYYLKWAFNYIIKNAPPNVKILLYNDKAISLDDYKEGKQILQLDKKMEPLVVDKVVLTLGHVDVEATEEEAELMRFAKENSLMYIPPNNPADVNLDFLGENEPVILRGLGLNFFDYMALLTIGRGGVFTREAGKLKYIKSEYEPKLYAGSRRGIPYHARGENEKGVAIRHIPLFITEEVIKDFQKQVNNGEKIDFYKDIWPLIAREVETVYYAALIKMKHGKDVADCFIIEYKNGCGDSDKEKNILKCIWQAKNV